MNVIALLLSVLPCTDHVPYTLLPGAVRQGAPILGDTIVSLFYINISLKSRLTLSNFNVQLNIPPSVESSAGGLPGQQPVPRDHPRDIR